MSGGGAEREGDTESEAGSRLPAISTEPDAGLELKMDCEDCEIMTWAKVGRLTDRATQVPQMFIFERERAQMGEGSGAGTEDLKQALC